MKSDKLSSLQIASLEFYLRSKLNPIAALAGFRPLDICLVIKDFTSCLIQLSFDIIHKSERTPKYKCCQNQWLKEEEKSSERDTTVAVELCPDSNPSIFQLSSENQRWERERFCQCVGWWHQLPANVTRLWGLTRLSQGWGPTSETMVHSDLSSASEGKVLHKAETNSDHRYNKFRNSVVWLS